MIEKREFWTRLLRFLRTARHWRKTRSPPRKMFSFIVKVYFTVEFSYFGLSGGGPIRKGRKSVEEAFFRLCTFREGVLAFLGSRGVD